MYIYIYSCVATGPYKQRSIKSFQKPLHSHQQTISDSKTMTFKFHHFSHSIPGLDLRPIQNPRPPSSLFAFLYHPTPLFHHQSHSPQVITSILSIPSSNHVCYRQRQQHNVLCSLKSFSSTVSTSSPTLCKYFTHSGFTPPRIFPLLNNTLPLYNPPIPHRPNQPVTFQSRPIPATATVTISASAGGGGGPYWDLFVRAAFSVCIVASKLGEIIEASLGGPAIDPTLLLGLLFVSVLVVGLVLMKILKVLLLDVLLGGGDKNKKNKNRKAAMVMIPVDHPAGVYPYYPGSPAGYDLEQRNTQEKKKQLELMQQQLRVQQQMQSQVNDTDKLHQLQQQQWLQEKLALEQKQQREKFIQEQKKQEAQRIVQENILLEQKKREEQRIAQEKILLEEVKQEEQRPAQENILLVQKEQDRQLQLQQKPIEKRQALDKSEAKQRDTINTSQKDSSVSTNSKDEKNLASYDDQVAARSRLLDWLTRSRSPNSIMDKGDRNQMIGEDNDPRQDQGQDQNTSQSNQLPSWATTSVAQEKSTEKKNIRPTTLPWWAIRGKDSKKDDLEYNTKH